MVIGLSAIHTLRSASDGVTSVIGDTLENMTWTNAPMSVPQKPKLPPQSQRRVLKAPATPLAMPPVEGEPVTLDARPQVIDEIIFERPLAVPLNE